MSQSYREPEHDDSVCSCGAKLPEHIEPFTWQDNGFCGVGCAVQFPGPMHIRGCGPVLELASMPGYQGGPGFEKLLLAGMMTRLAELPTGTKGILVLDKLRSEDDSRFSYLTGRWSWRIYRADQSGTFTPICDALRFTARAEEHA